MKLARVWVMDNIKFDLQGIELRSVDFFFRTWIDGGNFEIYGWNFGFFRNGIS
jgi:hypothetical protein